MALKPMDWDLGLCHDPGGKPMVFNQLLDSLRYMHEEVCARNTRLERELSRNGIPSSSDGKDDPWLPSNFLAPLEGPPPRRVPKFTSAPPTPRTQAADVLTRQQEYLSQTIDNLAEQQGYLSEQITKVLTISTVRRKPAPAVVHARLSAACASQQNGVIIHLASTGTASNAVEEPSRQQKSAVRATMRFAVNAANETYEQARRSFRIPEIQVKGCFGKLQRRGANVLNGMVFNTFTGLVILCYAVTIAIETDMMAKNPDMKSATIQSLHYLFTGFFCIELLFRCFALGMATFCGEDAFWNRLDAFFILSGASELIIEAAAGSKKAGSASSIARGVRIFRVFRTVRLIRSLRHLHEFQKMAYALLSSLKTLVCSLALLGFVMFFFAVAFTQSAANEQKRSEIQDLKLRYGDLWSTAYTLFGSVSNGISWDACYMPLHELNYLVAQIFILYIVIVYFGVLNVVTSVFVESVMRSVQNYKDLIVKDKEVEKKIAMAHVQEVFKQVDHDESGTVTLEEMEHFLKDDALSSYLEALDIDPGDARTLFQLLDYDNLGQVGIIEFCEGCLRLKGNAKSIDMAALSFSVRSFLHKWGEFTGYVEENFAEIRGALPKTKTNKAMNFRQ